MIDRAIARARSLAETARRLRPDIAVAAEAYVDALTTWRANPRAAGAPEHALAALTALDSALASARPATPARGPMKLASGAVEDRLHPKTRDRADPVESGF